MNLSVIGGGSWGTALTFILSKKIKLIGGKRKSSPLKLKIKKKHKYLTNCTLNLKHCYYH